MGRKALDAFNRLITEPRIKEVPAVLLLGDGHHAWQIETESDRHR